VTHDVDPTRLAPADSDGSLRIPDRQSDPIPDDEVSLEGALDPIGPSSHAFRASARSRRAELGWNENSLSARVDSGASTWLAGYGNTILHPAGNLLLPP
jgi:hypothetical protein